MVEYFQAVKPAPVGAKKVRTKTDRATVLGEAHDMPESLARAQQMTGGSLHFETVDIRDKEEIRKAFRKVSSGLFKKCSKCRLRFGSWGRGFESLPAIQLSFTSEVSEANFTK